MELYRYMMDDFLIGFCRNLNAKDFIVKAENIGRKKKGKREYLNRELTRKLMTLLDAFFETEVEIPRIKHGKNQTIETLINEEALLFGNFLRNEKRIWAPRIAYFNNKIKLPVMRN